MDRAGTRIELPWESLLLPLDRARASWNRLVLGSALGPSLVRKDTRIALRALVGISLAFALTVRCPLVLFAVAPVVLGVPHLAADLRYLLLQPRYGRSVRVLLGLGCAPFVAVRLLPLVGVGVTHEAQIELTLATLALCATAIAAGVSAGRIGRVAWLAPALLLLGGWSFAHAETARIVFAHLHNLIAIVVWGLLFRARSGARRALLLPVACTGLLTLALIAYGLRADAALGTERMFGLQLSSVASWLAPGFSPRLGIGLVLTFVFLQSVHYSIWLGLIPAEAVRGEAARSFRMSLRALLRDFGGVGLLVIVALSVTTVAVATRDLTRTREAYLTLSAFHGYLELAVLVIALCGQRDLLTTGKLGGARAPC